MTRSGNPSSTWLPWAWCNLRRNPFGELTRQERSELAVVDVESIVQNSRQHFQAVQLIGDCGRGKTTRMLALERRLPESSYVYLAEDEPCGPIPFGLPLLIDEAQRLQRRLRKQIFATGLPLVLATHRDLSRPLRSAGYSIYTVHVGAFNDADTVCRILNQRILASKLSDREVPVLSICQARELVRRFGSNIRSMEAYLYDRVQEQGNSHGEMRFID